ncbi:MAG TPA: Cof-type HAD-IIB family hydrolase [Symbiobacteriaceae bacterium]|nr:Cof-type HAD-IIB family hydrolase [Symbiobacteriaceae bacterium]
MTARGLLAMDLDGTLLRSDLTVSPGNQVAVAQVLEGGNFVALATGRVHRAAARYAEHWPDHSLWMITGNGSVVRPARGGEPIYERTLERAIAAEVVRWAQVNGLNFKIYLDDEMWVTEDRESSRLFCQARGIVYHVEPALASILPKGPTKGVLTEDPARIDLLEVEARERWGAQLSIIRSEPQYLEFMAPGVTKGTALAFLANHLGVAQADVAAIGNERNDLAMLEWAGFGGVVANAIPAVKEQAPRVVPHHDEDGVAAFIQEWLSR